MSEEQIRLVEYEVLDRQYRHYSLMRLPEELAITRLLKATGDIGRGINTHDGFGRSPASLHTFASMLSRGLSHCLRWVCTDCAPGEAVHGQNWRQEDNSAADFLHWGMRYALLATDHVAWSNSLIEATVDEDKKTVEFRPPKGIDAAYVKRQVQADLDWWKTEIGECFPTEAFVSVFNDWQQHAEWRTRGLEFSPDFVRQHVRFPELRARMTRALFPELDEDCLLGAYNLGHLRTFFAVIQTVCDCIRTLEDEVDKRAGYGGMGTWTFQLFRPAFIEWICEATGLSSKVVDSIVTDMTLDPRRFHCSITTTPFILSRRNHLFLLPRMFALLSPQRCFASALTTGSGRTAYDGIATRLEQFHLTRICSLLDGCGLRVLREKSFVTPDGEKLTPDIVVAGGRACEVVIVDFKNSLAATGVAEVTKRLREYNKGVAQIERYIDRFARFPVLLSSMLGLPASPPSVRGLLLFRVPMPLPVARISGVEVDDLTSMRQRLSSMRQAHPRDLFAPPIQALADEPAWRFQEIQVADWTYRRAVMYWRDRQAFGR